MMQKHTELKVYLKICWEIPDCRCLVVSGDITERFVTAGYGWDRVLQYHSKVGLVQGIQGDSCFNPLPWDFVFITDREESRKYIN